MPKQIQITVYSFAELVELHKAKEATSESLEKAKQWLREASTGFNWWQSVYEDWKTCLEEIGFTDPKFAFSGFWSQGDGASFTSGLDFEKLLAWFTKEGPRDPLLDLVSKVKQTRIEPRYQWLELAANYLSGEVERISHHYSHENTCRVSIDLDTRRDMPEVEKLVSDFRDAVEQLRKELSQSLYAALETEYEFRTSDEELAEMADANEYTFTKYGKRMG
jgi:hypothetical protein